MSTRSRYLGGVVLKQLAVALWFEGLAITMPRKPVFDLYCVEFINGESPSMTAFISLLFSRVTPLQLKRGRLPVATR